MEISKNFSFLVFLIGGAVAVTDKDFGFSLVGLSLLIFFIAKIGTWWTNK